jgi:hypothetical protein
MAKLNEKKIVAGSLIVLGILFSIIAAITDCSAGGADNYAHFNIARWAFRYPHLFLDHWGKPLFTTLISPFTQIGFYGARIFNILGGLLTAWICYLLAVKWRFKNAWLVPVFVIFAPMYFVLMFSGMTEILFSLVLMLAILLFFNDRFILSAVVISFIILVRSEGFIFLPIFFAAFTLKRKFFAIPFLLSGFVFFSLIGWLYYYHDFWWLIDKLPYVGGQGGIYGSGTWYHFLAKMPEYLDFFILGFFLVGMVYWLKEWYTSSLNINSEEFFRLLVLAGCFWGYLLAHSYVWWRGEMSLGLVRVMAGVTPVAGLIALAGWNWFEKLIRNKVVKITFLIVSLVLVVIPGVLRYKSAFQSDPIAVVINRVIEWLHETDNFRHHLIVHDPYIAFAAKVDAWDQQKLQYGFSDVNQPELGMPDSSVFIWDAHFSQNEGRIAESKILENPGYELLAYFEPEIPIKVLNGYDYCILVFRKVQTKSKDNFQILDELKSKMKNANLKYAEYFDFETSMPEKVNDTFRKFSTDSVTNHYYQLGGDCEFSPSVLLTDQQLKISNQLVVDVSFDFQTEETFAKSEALMVFSVEKDDKSYYYLGEDILPFIKATDHWDRANFSFTMPEQVEPDTKIKLYIWDIPKKKFKVDNFRVTVYSGESPK